MTDGGKPVVVGETNPYGDNPYYAMYPWPDGSAGHRLCSLVLRVPRLRYLDYFDRVNLCRGKWSVVEARKIVSELLSVPDRRLVLCGSKVSRAFGVPYEPYTVVSEKGCSLVVLPHPSGLCRLWNEPDSFDRARAAVLSVCPDLLVERSNLTEE